MLGALAVQRGDAFALPWVGDHDEMPSLGVRSGRRLERDLDAALDDVAFHRPRQVETLSYGTCGREKPVYGRDVDRGHGAPSRRASLAAALAAVCDDCRTIY